MLQSKIDKVWAGGQQVQHGVIHSLAVGHVQELESGQGLQELQANWGFDLQEQQICAAVLAKKNPVVADSIMVLR